MQQLTRHDHQAHIEEIAANLNLSNPKPFWSWLKKIRKNDNGIPQLYHGNEVHTTDAGKVEVLNRYFQLVFTREDTRNLQQIKAKLPGEPCPQSSVLCQSRRCKAGGPDGLPGRLLKEAASFIAKPLAKLFTKSPANIYKKSNCQ